MKKLFMLLVAALTTVVYAGGDIGKYTFTPAIDITQPTKVTYEEYGVSIGVGFARLEARTDNPDKSEVSEAGVVASIGYSVNEYLDVEAKYATNIGDLEDETGRNHNNDINTYGVYVKPKMEVGPVDVHGLAGYARTETSYGNYNGISYGGGLSANITDNTSVTVDYLRNDKDSDLTTNQVYSTINYNF